MSAGLDATPGRRAARLVATLGLCGGTFLLAAAAICLGVSLDVPTTDSAETRLPPLVDLSLAAVAVLGTILVSIGAVFALLNRIGFPAAVALPRHNGEALQPRDDLLAPASRHGEAPPPRSSLPEVRAPVPDHGAGLSGAGHAGSDAVPSRAGASDAQRDSRTGGASHLDRPDAAPSVTGVTPGTGTGGLALRGAAGAEFEEPSSSEPGASATETPARQIEVGGPPCAQTPQPADLIAAWDDYRREGDGHFSRRDFQNVLTQRGLAVDVSTGDRVDAGGAVLVVETPSSVRDFYVMPSFNKSPRAVADWFDDDSGGALTGRIGRVARVAQGRWLEPGTGAGRRFEVIEKGEVA